MRPVNLIPKEQRRGEHAPLRSGPLAYIVLGALVLVLAGVAALVLTGNQISERESEIATLEVEDAAARARAERLAPYTQFRSLSEQRVATIASLADSRFAWERGMRELALILPDDAWLCSLPPTAPAAGRGYCATWPSPCRRPLGWSASPQPPLRTFRLGVEVAKVVKAGV